MSYPTDSEPSAHVEGIIYNVTTKVESRIAAEWLEWMNKEHIPEIIATGCFTRAAVLRLLDMDESEGPTYAVQYFTSTRALYHQYRQQFAERVARNARDKWGDAFVSFDSALEVVN